MVKEGQKNASRHSGRLGVSFASVVRGEFLVSLGDFQQRFPSCGIGLLIGSSTCLVSTLGTPHTTQTLTAYGKVEFAQISPPDYLLILAGMAIRSREKDWVAFRICALE